MFCRSGSKQWLLSFRCFKQKKQKKKLKLHHDTLFPLLNDRYEIVCKALLKMLLGKSYPAFWFCCFAIHFISLFLSTFLSISFCLFLSLSVSLCLSQSLSVSLCLSLSLSVCLSVSLSLSSGGCKRMYYCPTVDIQQLWRMRSPQRGQKITTIITLERQKMNREENCHRKNEIIKRLSKQGRWLRMIGRLGKSN